MTIARSILSIISSYLEATANILVEQRLSAIADRVAKPTILSVL